MFEGIAYSILAGCCFAAGAGLFAAVARRGLPFMLFLSYGAIIGLVLSLAAIVDWRYLGSEERIGDLALWIIPGAIANIAGHLAMARAMAIGRGPVAWAIGQGGLAVPFVATVMIWKEKTGLFSWFGLFLIIAGVALLARTRNSAASKIPSRGWVFWSLAAMTCYGMNQTLMSVPSHWPGWTDVAHLRLPMTLGVVGIAGILCSPRPDLQTIRRLLPWVFPYGLVICACFAMVYMGLDRLSVAGCAAVAWPLACSTGIVGYALWEHVMQRRHVAMMEVFGIAVVVAGISALAIKT